MLEALLEKQQVWRGASPAFQPACVSTGFPTLDEALAGGWPRGALTELLAAREGFGELQLVLPALAALTRQGRRVAWLAPPHLPYAPALAAAGLDLTRLVVLRAPGRRDALWAAEQVLRAEEGCEALLAWLPDARYAELRRLAVAAGEGRACALLFRPLAAAAGSSPAALRLALEPAGMGVGVQVLKCRGRAPSAALEIAVWKPLHALGRAALSLAPGPLLAGPAGADRRLGLPVHA
jgi:cell division inhibitor SulA/protein ImuA